MDNGLSVFLILFVLAMAALVGQGIRANKIRKHERSSKASS